MKKVKEDTWGNMYKDIRTGLRQKLIILADVFHKTHEDLFQ